MRPSSLGSGAYPLTSSFESQRSGTGGSWPFSGSSMFDSNPTVYAGTEASLPPYGIDLRLNRFSGSKPKVSFKNSLPSEPLSFDFPNTTSAFASTLKIEPYGEEKKDQRPIVHIHGPTTFFVVSSEQLNTLGQDLCVDEASSLACRDLRPRRPICGRVSPRLIRSSVDHCHSRVDFEGVPCKQCDSYSGGSRSIGRPIAPRYQENTSLRSASEEDASARVRQIRSFIQGGVCPQWLKQKIKLLDGEPVMALLPPPLQNRVYSWLAMDERQANLAKALSKQRHR